MLSSFPLYISGEPVAEESALRPQWKRAPFSKVNANSFGNTQQIVRSVVSSNNNGGGQQQQQQKFVNGKVVPEPGWLPILSPGGGPGNQQQPLPPLPPPPPPPPSTVTTTRRIVGNDAYNQATRKAVEQKAKQSKR